MMEKRIRSFWKRRNYLRSWRFPSWLEKEVGSDRISIMDDDCADSVLVKEALEAGLSLEQIRQAKDELNTPSSTKECKHLKEGSISKKMIDIWVDNR
jgi:hypothetical protein